MNSQLVGSSALVSEVDALPSQVRFTLGGRPPPAPVVPWEHSLPLVPVPAPDLPHRANHGSIPGSLQPHPWAGSRQLRGRFVPALQMLPEPKSRTLMQTPFASKQNGQQPLAEKHRGASGSTASSIGSAGPPKGRLSRTSLHFLNQVSCFTQRNSGRQLMCCQFTPWFTCY